MRCESSGCGDAFIVLSALATNHWPLFLPVRNAANLTPQRHALRILPTSQDCGHDAGVAARVHHRDNPQGFFLGCVGNQVFTHQNEPQGARGEVRAAVALMGKSYEPAKGVKNFRDDPIGCVRVFLGKVIADIVEVGVGFQVERLAAAHAGCLRCAWVLAFSRAKASSPSMGFIRPLFSSS